MPELQCWKSEIRNVNIVIKDIRIFFSHPNISDSLNKMDVSACYCTSDNRCFMLLLGITLITKIDRCEFYSAYTKFDANKFTL